MRCSKDVTFDDAQEYAYWSEENVPATNDFAEIIPEVVPISQGTPYGIVPLEDPPLPPQYPPRDNIPLQPENKPPAPIEQLLIRN